MFDFLGGGGGKDDGVVALFPKSSFGQRPMHRFFFRTASFTFLILLFATGTTMSPLLVSIKWLIYLAWIVTSILYKNPVFRQIPYRVSVGLAGCVFVEFLIYVVGLI